MAVKLRLTRMGAKKKPTYRIVATDSRRPRDGQYLELVGTYAPVGECKVRIDEEKAASIILDDFRSGKIGKITLERCNK